MDDLAATLNQLVGWVLGSSWGLPESFSTSAWLLRPVGLTIIGVVVLEQLFPLDQRRFNRSNLDTASYILIGGKIAVFAVVVAPLLKQAWHGLGLPSLELTERLPYPAAAALGLLVVSFGDYWAHRWLHRVGWLWHIHKIHHAPAKLHWATRYHAHFAMQIIHTPIVGGLSLLMGTKMLAPFVALMILIDYFAHANIRLKFGWLNYLIVTPETHRFHHSSDPIHFNKNFSNSLPFWDVLFGTFHYDAARPPTEFGLTEVPAGFVRQQLLPLKWIASDVKAAAARLWRTGRG